MRYHIIILTITVLVALTRGQVNPKFKVPKIPDVPEYSKDVKVPEVPEYSKTPEVSEVPKVTNMPEYSHEVSAAPQPPTDPPVPAPAAALMAKHEMVMEKAEESLQAEPAIVSRHYEKSKAPAGFPVFNYQNYEFPDFKKESSFDHFTYNPALNGTVGYNGTVGHTNTHLDGKATNVENFHYPSTLYQDYPQPPTYTDQEAPIDYQVPNNNYHPTNNYQPPVNSHPPANYQNSAVNNYQPEVNNYQPPVNYNKPEVNNYQPSVNFNKPDVNNYQPPVNYNKLEVNNYQPHVNYQPPVNYNKPANYHPVNNYPQQGGYKPEAGYTPTYNNKVPVTDYQRVPVPGYNNNNQPSNQYTKTVEEGQRSYYRLDTCEYRFILDMVQCHQTEKYDESYKKQAYGRYQNQGPYYPGYQGYSYETPNSNRYMDFYNLYGNPMSYMGHTAYNNQQSNKPTYMDNSLFNFQPSVGHPFYAPGFHNTPFAKYYAQFRAGPYFNDQQSEVRSYHKEGQYRSALEDYNNLHLRNVVKRTSESSHLEKNSQQISSSPDYGYEGLTPAFNYRVRLMPNHCTMPGYPGKHTCIIFSGATHPYKMVHRQFIYVKKSREIKDNYKFRYEKQQQANFNGGYPH